MHSERFVGDMVNALQHNTINEFKTAYRSLDALLIDDIQFFAGKDRSQEEFFHTFNALLEGQQQIILTCDRYPKEVEGLEERLKSRFGWGLTVAIEPPELETCVAILMSKAAGRGVICRKKSRSSSRSASARTCASSRARCAAWSRTRSSPAARSRWISPRKRCATCWRCRIASVTIENIQKTVAEYYKIRVADLLSKRRSRSIARPRQVAMALAKELTSHSLAGDRRCFRRARPHDGAACVPRDQGAARVEHAYQRGLLKPVENPGWMTVDRVCGPGDKIDPQTAPQLWDTYRQFA